MEVTDEQLMLAYRDGDGAAFETLYARHKGALFRFVLRGVHSRAHAEELYQEIWMRVIQARLGYRPRARFRTWLFTIAHHRLVDHWRRHEPAALPLEEVGAAALQVAANPAAQPERQAELREDLARLAQAIAVLPAAQREAFLLQQEGGLAAGEIAAVTGAGEEAVKSRLRYAHARLRAAFDDGGT
jgi:RNA polymerase sigma-70 factor (ECF subfamily)